MMFGAMSRPQLGDIDPRLEALMRQGWGDAQNPAGAMSLSGDAGAPTPMPGGMPSPMGQDPFAGSRIPAHTPSDPGATLPGTYGGNPLMQPTQPSMLSMPSVGVGGGMFGSPDDAARKPKAPALPMGSDPFTSALPGPDMGQSGPMTTAPDMGSIMGDLSRQTTNMNIKKPAFFAKDGAWRPTLEAISEMAMELGGNPGQMAYLQSKWAGQREAANDARSRATRLAELQQAEAAATAERMAKLMQPDYFTVGNDRVKYDPANRTSTTIFTAPTSGEEYAKSLGLTPGTKEYVSALKDYALKGSGPTAYGNDVSLAGVRAGYSASLKSQPTYAELHPRARVGGGGTGKLTLTGVVAPILAKMAAGKPLTPAEQAAWSAYRPGRKGAATVGGGSNTVVNPATGEKKSWNGTAWVTVR